VPVAGLQTFLERNRGGDSATSTDRSGRAADPRSGDSVEPFGGATERRCLGLSRQSQ
jgi:hypothetical protein